MSISLSSVKTLLQNLPKIRQELVATLTAAGTVVGVLTSLHLPGSTVAVLSSVSAAIVGAGTFLANKDVVAIITDVANAVTPKSLKALVSRHR